MRYSGSHLQKEWVYLFIHIRVMIQRNWYMSTELHQGTIEWDELVTRFTHIFIFVDDSLMVDTSMHIIKGYSFEEIPILMSIFPQRNDLIQSWMECYNLIGETKYYYACDIHIHEY